MLEWPVDEVVGTGVDLLVLGLGYGDVYFHNSKVGRVVGQRKEVWENYIDWRIMRMVEEGEKLDTDQVREVIQRGRHLVLPCINWRNNVYCGHGTDIDPHLSDGRGSHHSGEMGTVRYH